MSLFKDCAQKLVKPLIVAVALAPVFFQAGKVMAQPDRTEAFEMCLKEKDPSLFERREPAPLDKTRINIFKKEVVFLSVDSDQPPAVSVKMGETGANTHPTEVIFDAAHDSVRIVHFSNLFGPTSSTYSGKGLTPNEASRLKLMQRCARDVGYTDIKNE